MPTQDSLKRFIQTVAPSLRQLKDPIFIMDTELKIVWANEATYSVLRSDAKELIGNYCFKAIHGQEKPIGPCLAEACITTKEPHFFSANEPKLGGWIDVNVSPVFDEDGNIIGILHIAHNIDQLKYYQRELQYTRDILANIINSTPDLICYKDAEGRIIEANTAYLRNFEISGEGYKGKKNTELALLSKLPKWIFEHCEKMDEEVWRLRRPIHVREQFAPPGRPPRIMDALKIPLFNPDGTPKGLIVVARDITELELEKSALKEISQRQQAILDYAPVGILFLAPDQRILYANKKAKSLFRWTDGAPKDFSLLEPNSTKGSSEDREGEIHTKLLQGKTIFQERRLSRQDGTRFWARLTGALIDPKDPDKGSIWIIEDIEREKVLLEEIKRSEETFRTITELASDGIVVMDKFGRVTFWNPAAERLFGYKRDEVLGKDLHLLLAPKRLHKRYYEGFKRFTQTGRTNLANRLLQFPAVTKNGHEIYVELSFSVMNLGGEFFALGIIRDITERIETEREKRLLEEKAQKMQLLDSLGTLAGSIAHDFNNLLMGISGFTDLIVLDKHDPEKIERHTQKIQNAVKKASQLTKAMLAYTGEQSLVKRPVDVGLLLNDVVPALKTHIPKKSKLEIDMPEYLPKVEGDPAQIVQAVTNILVNAAESLENGKGVVCLKAYTTRLTQRDLMHPHCIASDEAAPGWYLCISCSDTGHGMDEETLKRMFEPFYSTKFFGRGLGLTAVLGIMKAHRGAVFVESEKDKGTIIKLYFPVSSDST